MAYKRYYNNYEPQMPISPKSIDQGKVFTPKTESLPPLQEKKPPLEASLFKFLNNLHTDDLVLLGLLFLLLKDGCEDTLLLLALGYIFFSGLDDNPFNIK